MKQAFNWQSQQRVDVPHLLMLENSIIFDGKTLMTMQQGSVAYILTGFDIATPWSFGQPANSLQVVVQNAAVTLTQDPNGSFLTIPSGTPNSQLNSANTQVTGSFTPSSTNYVSIQFTRLPDPATADLVAFWDEDASTEFTETVPLGLVLNFQFNINTSGFGVNAPICEVVTDAFNNIISITNCKQGLYRLGSGGATPNANNEFILTLNPENPLTATSSAVDPFQGGDWQLANMKNWMDEVMTQIKQIKGTAYWYSPGSSVVASINLVDVFFDTDSSVLTSGGSFTHNAAVAGQLSWNEPVYIRSIIGNLYYTIPINSVELAPGQVAYIELVRNVLAQSGAQFTFTNGSTLVTCSIPITDANLTSSANTWIKTIGGDMSEWVQVSGTVTPSSLTFNLTAPYPFATVVDKAVLALATYNVNVADPVNVPASGDSYWIAKRDDNWPSPTSVPPGPASWPLALSGTIARVTNEVTADTASPHGLAVGQTIVIAGITSDPTLNGTYQITNIPTLSSFKYDSVGSDFSGAASPGTVTPGAVIYLRNNRTLPQGESIAVDNIDTNNIITYIGSKGESDTSPSYSDAFSGSPTPNNVVTDGNNLTQAIKQLDTQDGIIAVEQNQDRNLKLIEGGTWLFNGVTKTLSWSATGYIQIPDLALTSNTINAGSAVFVNDGDVAYIELNRLTNSPTVLTVTVAAGATLSMDGNTLIIARYFAGPPNYVIFGNASTALYDGQAAVIDGGVALVSDFFNELRMFAANPNSSRVILEDSDIVMPTGEERSQRISSFLLNFDGAQIDFQTGNIYKADGATALGVNFSPVIPAIGMWRWFSVTVIPSSVGGDNRMSGQILILAASADGASASAAPRAIFAGGSGIGIGQVVITSSDGINVTAITQADLVQLSAGSGSGSGGGINKVDVFDPVSTTLSTSTPTVIDGVTVVTGLTGLFSNLASGNNEVYQATVTGGGSSPALPNPIVMSISNANPYLGGNMESVTGGVATPEASNDSWFEIDGTSAGGANPAIAGHFNLGGVFSDITTNADWKDQPFVAAVTGPIGSVTIRTYWDATAGNGNLNLSIWTDNAGVPGTRISSIAPINTANLAATATSSVTPSQITTYFSYGSLTSGQTYHLVMDPTNVSLASTLRICVASSGATNPNFLTSTDGGVTWAPNASVNANFIITVNSGLMASNVAGSQVADAINITTTSNVAAQPFTPTITQAVAAVQYTMSRASGVLGGTFSVGIYNDSAGSPGSVINSVNVNASTITTGGDEIDYVLTQLTTASNIVGGNPYWLIWNFANVTGLGGSGIIFLGVNSCTASQPPELSLSTDGGSTYPAVSSTSANFAVLSSTRGSGDTSVGQYNNGTQYNALTGSNYATSQPFLASASGTVVSGSVDIWIGNGSVYNGYITVGIYSDNGSGQPGSLLSNLSSIPHNLIPTAPGNFNPYNFVGATLVSGTKYHFVTSLSHLTLFSGTYEIRIASDTPSLTSPNAILSTDTGSTFPTTLMDGGSPVNQHYFVAINNNRIATNDVGFVTPPSQQMNFQASSTTANWRGQPFTAPSTIVMGSIKIPLKTNAASGVLGGNIRIAIYSNGGSVPGLRLSQYSFIDASTLTTDFQNYSVPQSLGLTSGSLYFIVLDTSLVTGIAVSAEVQWGAWIISSTSVPPSGVQTLNSGSTWSSGGGGVTNIFDVYPPFVSGASSFVIASNSSINTTENETTNLTSKGQTFTSTGSGFFTDAIFKLSIATASPVNSGNLTVKLYTDSAGQPGTLLETSSPINSAGLTTTPTNYTFNFSGSTPVTTSTLYHAILDTSALSGTVTPGVISWTPQPIFSTPYTPTAGDEVIITEGTEFHDQVAEFNGVAGTWLINNTVRYFNGTDYWEQSALITSTLVNNTTANVFSVTALGSENIKVDYSCLRNGVKEMGTVWLTNDGTNSAVAGGDSYTGSVGLTFTSSLTSGNVNLIYTLDNSGGAGTLKYSIKRWSDGPGGPTGVPNYSPFVPSTVINSAFTMSDGSSTPYNCSSPVNVLGLTNITLNFSYPVGVNAGTTVGALSVRVNGQIVSRFVSSAVTPPSVGTMYTEISATQIQFTTNIMAAPVPVEIVLE